jgi:hypothetical protein
MQRMDLRRCKRICECTAFSQEEKKEKDKR